MKIKVWKELFTVAKVKEPVKDAFALRPVLP